jgi:hypothetical protein
MENATWRTITAGPVTGPSGDQREAVERTDALTCGSHGMLFRTIVISKDGGVSVSLTWAPGVSS